MLLNILRLCLDMKSSFNERLKEYDLTFTQWQVLKAIKSSGNNYLTVLEIVSSLKSDKATISTVIKKLENKNMIEVKVDSLDKRTKQIYISQYMLAKCEELKLIEEEYFKDIMKYLSEEEIKQFLDLIQKIEKGVFELEKEKDE